MSFEFNKRKLPVPPYVAYDRFKKAIGDMRGSSFPDRITWAAFPGFTTALRSQLAKAFKALGLADETRRPTDALVNLVQAYGTAQWPAQLSEIIRLGYGPIFKEPGSYTHEQLLRRFTDLYDANTPTLQKSVRFLTNAMADAQLKFDPPPIELRKAAKALPPEPAPRTTNSAVTSEFQLDSHQKAYHLLLDKIYDPALMKAESIAEQAVFALARFLKSRVDSAPSDQ